MKKFILSIFSIIVLLFIAGCNSNDASPPDNSKDKGASGEKTITLSLASFVPTQHIFSEHVEQALMDRVTELTDGKVKFDYFPAGQMGAAPDLFGLAADKTVDIAFITPAYVPSEMKLSDSLFALTGLFNNTYEGSLAYSKISQESPLLEEDYLKNGVRPIFTMTSAPYDIYTDGPEVKVPSDLKKLKIRAAGGAKTESLDFAGASPVTLSVGDLFSALDRGVVEGVHSYHMDIEGYGVVEKLKFATNNLGFGAIAFGLVMNEEVYQGLSEDVQEAFKQASSEILESFTKVYNEEYIAVGERLAEKGITVYEPSESERQEWDAFYNEFNEKMMEKINNDEFNEVLEAFKKEIEALR